MAAPMGTTTKQPTSNQGHLQSLIAKIRKEVRRPTQIEISYANNFTQAVEKEAWKESQEVRNSMLGVAQDARRMFGLRPFDMSLNVENEADGKEMVLRNGGKRSASTAPAPNASKRQQREPIRPPPPPTSGKIDQKSEALDQSGRVRHIKEENTVTNSQNGPHGHGHSQSIEAPFATSFLTNSAPIYNQNINSGSGQQNINVYGVFEPPPPPATGAAPTEYEIPTEPEHRLNRDPGQQKLSINDTVTNKTAGDGNPGGHKQTLKGPHGNTHMRMTAPVYNQNVNTGSGQQNIDVIGKMDFEKKDRKERPRQGPIVAVAQSANPQPQRRDDQGTVHITGRLRLKALQLQPGRTQFHYHSDATMKHLVVHSIDQLRLTIDQPRLSMDQLRLSIDQPRRSTRMDQLRFTVDLAHLAAASPRVVTVAQWMSTGIVRTGGVMVFHMRMLRMIQKMTGRDQMVWIVLVQELRVADAEMSGMMADDDESKRKDRGQAFS
ncbi:uncharacterized protein J4E79_003694 [Alternaria viburni]|uniref:uncharacterized protein n=1 Tax=Alternaria viburni TaxID=566460 RepID=UPI0020C2223A|nr:uncharacterized protein J4E79_003694 [Alternaria viburni]KAI4664192.1 hypothetical protein J4E79_003694 [Alternaria viburni]